MVFLILLMLKQQVSSTPGYNNDADKLPVVPVWKPRYLPLSGCLHLASGAGLSGAGFRSCQ